jgi:hypothetical protein
MHVPQKRNQEKTMPRNIHQDPVKARTLDKRQEKLRQQPAPKPVKPHQLDKKPGK